MAILDSLGQAYGKSPSSYLGIEDRWAAYQFDLSARLIGAHEYEKELEARKTKTGASGASSTARPASPAGKPVKHASLRDTPGIKKMTIPEDGIW